MGFWPKDGKATLEKDRPVDAPDWGWELAEGVADAGAAADDAAAALENENPVADGAAAPNKPAPVAGVVAGVACAPVGAAPKRGAAVVPRPVPAAAGVAAAFGAVPASENPVLTPNPKEGVDEAVAAEEAAEEAAAACPKREPAGVLEAEAEAGA